MNNKKGISAVVATVLIILITVAAVTIIWAAIIPMINKNLDKATVCFDANSQLSVNNDYTCFDDANDQVKVQVGHGAKDIGLTGIQILISDNAGDTTSFEQTSDLPGVNGEKVFTLSYTSAAESVKVAPIVKIGSSNETCDALAAVELKAC